MFEIDQGQEFNTVNPVFFVFKIIDLAILSIRNNTDNLRSSLRTFKAPHNSFVGGSPSRSVPPPTLADLEFPPPPTDLPPPPEEFDSIDTVDCTATIMTSSTELKKKIVPMSPMLPSKKLNRELLDNSEGGGDVSTLQPSVEEASSR